MPHGPGGVLLVCICVAAFTATLAAPVRAQHVWTGLSYAFTKPNSADPELEVHQDRISSTVWLTRGEFFGMLNAVSDRFEGELVYSPNFSPAGTRWATGAMLANSGKTIAASNHAALTFTSWQQAYGGMSALATNILVHPAVVHLTAEDIYLDLQFTSWTVGGGGGFRYVRSVLPGDFNGDGRVDAGDYVHWRNRLGEPVDNPGDGADLDHSGFVDIGDYLEWKARYGDTVPLPPGGDALGFAVPEPMGAPLVTVGSAVVSWMVVRRRVVGT